MKKSVSVKLIVFSFLLVVNTTTFSDVEFKRHDTFRSILAGEDNKVIGNFSTAFGYSNHALKEGASAFGLKNTACKSYTSAFGYSNVADGDYSSAFGSRNTANGEDSSAFGYFNKASGEGSSAFGNENRATGNESSTFGSENAASGEMSTAFGQINSAFGKLSSAFGNRNRADGEKSSAFGNDNRAYEKNNVIFGNDNKALGKNSIIFGNSNSVGVLKAVDTPDPNLGNDSLILGNAYRVHGNRSGVIGIGEYDSTLLTYSYANNGDDSYMIGNDNHISTGSNNNFILGNDVDIGVGVQRSVVLGDSSASGGSYTVSVGSRTLKRKIVHVKDGTISATSTDAVTGKQLYSGDGIDTATWKAKLGVGSAVDAYTKAQSDAKYLDKTSYNTDKANFATKTDLGKFADASSTDINVAAWKAKLGVGSGGGGGIANTATGTGSLALGEGTTVTGDYSTAVGYKNKVTGNHSGAFGDPNKVTGNRSYVFGNDNTVTGNGSYAFGNDNTINGNNNFVLGNNVTIDAAIQNSVALGNNSTVSSSNEVSVGSKGKERKITNVADGEVSATSTDAVTGKQLYKAMQNSGALGVENLRNEVYEKIDDVKDEVRGVGSLSAALAGLHPMQYDPKAPAQVMAALGHYKDRQAVAVGASYYFNDRFMMSTGVALSGEKKTKTMANVGFTLKLGKGSGTTYSETPQYVVQNEVKRLTVENQELKERVRNLEEKLNMLLKSK